MPDRGFSEVWTRSAVWIRAEVSEPFRVPSSGIRSSAWKLSSFSEFATTAREHGSSDGTIREAIIQAIAYMPVEGLSRSWQQ